MKTLALVRHAKSSWDDPTIDDHDRPLNGRGRKDAPMMGRRMAERGFRPGIILSSSAVRAQSTADAIAAELGLAPTDVVIDTRLYGAWPSAILGVVAALDDSIASAMVVAHDPGMSDLAARLSPSVERMPTCAVAVFSFDVARWADIPGARPVLDWFDVPGSGQANVD